MKPLVVVLLVSIGSVGASAAATSPSKEKKITSAAIVAAAEQTAVASESEAASQQTEEETTNELEAAEKEPPTTEEVAGKTDALSEAFTELKNIVDGLSRMKLSGYIQPQYVHDESSVNDLTSPTATKNRDQFSVRRARVKFTYQASPTSRFVLQPDITSSGVTLKDGYVEFTEPWSSWHHTLTAGQFNWPFGFEIMYSSSDREMPERSRVVRALFPGERDRGVQFSGVGFGERINYRLAIVNGTGTTQSFDFNKRKDVVGRLGGVFGPLDIGVSVYRGRDLVPTTERPDGIEFAKRRQGIDAQLITPIPGLAVRGEFITGEEKGVDVEGWYAYLVQNLGIRNQIIVRADSYDPNADGALSPSASRAEVLTLGGSYIFHWDANSKVMFAYEHPETDFTTDPDDDVATLRYQYKF